MGDYRLEYNLRAIRELLVAAYSADELRALISYDEELGPLRHQFSPNVMQSTEWPGPARTGPCSCRCFIVLQERPDDETHSTH